MPKIPLEDNFTDVLGKAQRGQHLTDDALAAKAGVPAADIAALHAGEIKEHALRATARALRLSGNALVALARREWYPEQPLFPRGFAMFNTPFGGDLTVNSYLVWDTRTRLAAAFDTGTDAGPILDTVSAEGLVLRYIFLTHTHDDHVAELPRRHPGVTFAAAEAGLPRQRNAILDAAAAEGCDLVLFLDDDFLPAPAYVAALEAVMRARPDCVVATGTVLADGAKGPGITVAEGRAILARDGYAGDPLAAAPHFNGYGCNMAVRLAPVRAHRLRFDEALPLYAWYEDIDFTRRLGAHGAILRLAGARGVHLGAKGGRVPGRRLGYSQVVNPVYLARKGSFPWSHALPSAARHCAINLARSLAPEPEVDRFGRFRGNLLGIWDLLRGRAEPRRILDL